MRVVIRNELTEGDRRPVYQVLLDALHTADVLMRQAQVALGETGTITPDQMTRLVESLERAGRMAKITIDAKVAEMQVRDMHQQAAALSPLLVPLLNLLDEYAPADVAMNARANLARDLEELDGNGWAPQPAADAWAGSTRRTIPGYVVNVEDAG